MRTSHLAIVGTMILALSGMGFLYLHDRDKVQQYSQDTPSSTTHSKTNKQEEKLAQLILENETLKDKRRITELEQEIELLKRNQNSNTATTSSLNNYVPTTPQEISELEQLRAENERLKHQNKLASEESSIIVSKGLEIKEKDAQRTEYITQAKTLAKVEEINAAHYFIVINPIGQPNFSTKSDKKEKLYVRRKGELLLALTVDSLDANTGKYITSIDMNSTAAAIEKVQAGDEVILAWEGDSLPEESLSLPIVNQLPDGTSVPMLPEDIKKSHNQETPEAPPLPEFSAP